MKIKLMLVEDQELIRESLNIVLGMEEDFDLIGAVVNGEEAIKICEKQLPNVILMDINMPIMDGIEATKVIKNKWPSVQIIILTTFEEVQYVKAALSYGAEGYLLKAIHPKDLAASIRLVHRGETLINQGLAKQLLASIPQENKEDSIYTKFGLSEREGQILQAIANGLSNKQISQKLFLTEGTVKNYVSKIYAKLDVQDRIGALNKFNEI
ncbi:response regulator receiver protein [Bacillus coahuilensis m2-6]|uniref:Response regulator receiver protein n=1 Tax=Bacillus coahuilensis p1.1.43 TaxID=1150625 RepID=A0A147K533_9BACI|nr:response regulator transcription factor [Bacillus coahuilensis]KUP04342.1 response regulator receiver protein [Bacillus coahuilensis m2-6]KUP04690.1 response regulator receiver protein [Bacillus coahuilensis p1.1.43]